MNWETAASLGTAGGTLILAVATFASVRSSNRSARLAEESMLAAVRPLVVNSRLDDPDQEVRFRDGHLLHVPGGGAATDVKESAIYLAISVRNVSQGIAVLDRWRLIPETVDVTADHADPRTFSQMNRDLYTPAGGIGFWQGALRNPLDPLFAAARSAIADRREMSVELVYVDHLGGQHAIVRFAIRPAGDDRWVAASIRHWNLERPDPRSFG